MYDVIVIGAGAAGMMAAGRAASDGRRVLVVEKMEKAGRKVRITGKGRCNVTNTRPREEFLEHVRANAGFFARSFERFDNRSVIRFFKDEGVPLAYERGERVFPKSGKAWDIADALYDYAREAGAEFMFHTRATGLRTVAGKITGVDIVTRKGYERKVDCRNVIVATGGVSYPSTGSTGDGYTLADRAGHAIEPVHPALVPLVAAGESALRLRGVKLKNTGVTLLVDGEAVESIQGEMEFGTRGLEGAVILRLSRRAVDALIDGRQVAVSLDLKTALDVPTIVARIGREVDAEPELTYGGLIRRMLPAPMVPVFCDMSGIAMESPAGELSEGQREAVAGLLKGWRIEIADYRPFEEAVITAGGVSTDDIDPDTLESLLVKGLYFAGEVLDIDADTGGYNLQIAFSTGYVAGGLGGYSTSGAGSSLETLPGSNSTNGPGKGEPACPADGDTAGKNGENSGPGSTTPGKPDSAVKSISGRRTRVSRADGDKGEQGKTSGDITGGISDAKGGPERSAPGGPVYESKSGAERNPAGGLNGASTGGPANKSSGGISGAAASGAESNPAGRSVTGLGVKNTGGPVSKPATGRDGNNTGGRGGRSRKP